MSGGVLQLIQGVRLRVMAQAWAVSGAAAEISSACNACSFSASSALSGVSPDSHRDSRGCGIPVSLDISDCESRAVLRSSRIKLVVALMPTSYTLAHRERKSPSNYPGVHSLKMDPRKLMQDLMDAQGLNTNSLAAATKNKTRQPQIYRFLDGTSKEPKRSTLVPVACFFGVPVEAFFDPKVADDVYREKLGGRLGAQPGSGPGPEQTLVLIAKMAERMSPSRQEQLLAAAEVLSGPLGDRISMSFSVAGPRSSEPTEAPAQAQKKPA